MTLLVNCCYCLNNRGDHQCYWHRTRSMYVNHPIYFCAHPLHWTVVISATKLETTSSLTNPKVNLIIKHKKKIKKKLKQIETNTFKVHQIRTGARHPYLLKLNPSFADKWCSSFVQKTIPQAVQVDNRRQALDADELAWPLHKLALLWFWCIQGWPTTQQTKQNCYDRQRTICILFSWSVCIWAIV